MESKNELQEIDIKNRTCYYFDDIITDRDICCVDILLDEKSYETYESILVYYISYKTSSVSKPSRLKIDIFVRVLDGEIKR